MMLGIQANIIRLRNYIHNAVVIARAHSVTRKIFFFIGLHIYILKLYTKCFSPFFLFQ